MTTQLTLKRKDREYGVSWKPVTVNTMTQYEGMKLTLEMLMSVHNLWTLWPRSYFQLIFNFSQKAVCGIHNILQNSRDQTASILYIVRISDKEHFNGVPPPPCIIEQYFKLTVVGGEEIV